MHFTWTVTWIMRPLPRLVLALLSPGLLPGPRQGKGGAGRPPDIPRALSWSQDIVCGQAGVGQWFPRWPSGLWVGWAGNCGAPSLKLGVLHGCIVPVFLFLIPPGGLGLAPQFPWL